MQEGVTSVGPGPQRAEAPKGEAAVGGIGRAEPPAVGGAEYVGC